MLEELGLGDVSSVRLLYLIGPKVLERSVSSEDRKKIIATLVETKQDVDKYCSEGEFPAKPGVLCNWCTFKKICPAWKTKK